MKAAVYDRPGSPDVLRYKEVSDPTPEGAELLIRVEAISVEGGDVRARQKRHPDGDDAVLGYAAAGEVVGVGASASGFRVGQKVTTFGFQGSHAELRAVSAATSWIVPAGLDINVAAAIPCGPGTAAYSLELAHVTAGQSVLVCGATGGVGFAAVQLASQMGARVLGTGSSASALERMKEFGLSDIVVVGGESIEDQVRRTLDGGGADVLVDCIGGPTHMDALSSIRDGGVAVLVGTTGGSEHVVDAIHLMAHRKTAIGCFLGPIMAEPSAHQMIASLLQKATSGELVVPIDAVFPLSEAASAHARAEERGRIGRVIIQP